MKNLLIIFCLLLPLFAVQADTAPDWVTNQSRGNPEVFLSATGIADNPELAKDRALGNLAKIFEAQISDISSRQTATSVNIEMGVETLEQAHQLTQRVQVKSDMVIRGAVISEIWHDPVLQLYHALAELNRVQAKNNLYDEIMQLDADTRALLKQQKSSPHRLQRIAYINRAIELQQQRQGLQRMLKIVDRHGRGDEPPWRLSELKLLLEQQLQDLSVSLHIVSEDVSGKLEKTLLSAMLNAGIRASADGDYQLVAELDVNDLGLQQGWYWQRAVLELQLKQAGQVLGSQFLHFKVAALQQAQLERRLLLMIRQRLDDELYASLLGLASPGGR